MYSLLARKGNQKGKGHCEQNQVRLGNSVFVVQSTKNFGDKINDRKEVRKRNSIDV